MNTHLEADHDALCDICVESWRRLSTPMEGGDCFLGLLRPRLDVLYIEKALRLELQHSPDCSRMCSAIGTERSEEGRNLARLRIFGSLYLSCKDSITDVSMNGMAFQLFPAVIGPFECNEDGISSGIHLLHTGARAISFSLTYSAAECSDSSLGSHSASIFHEALLKWRRLAQLLPQEIPRGRLQVEIDLSAAMEDVGGDMEEWHRIYVDFAAHVRSRVRAICLRLPSFLLEAKLFEAIARANASANAAEPSATICLVFDLPPGHSARLLPVLVPLENVMIQGCFKTDEESNGIDSIAECIWTCVRYVEWSWSCTYWFVQLPF